MSRMVLDDGMTPTDAATLFRVARATAHKWAKRYKAEGPAGLLTWWPLEADAPHRLILHMRHEE